MPTSTVGGKRWRCECGCREIEVLMKVTKAEVVSIFPNEGAPVYINGQVIGLPDPPYMFRCRSCHEPIAQSADELLQAARDGNGARWQRPIVTADDVRTAPGGGFRADVEAIRQQLRNRLGPPPPIIPMTIIHEARATLPPGEATWPHFRPHRTEQEPAQEEEPTVPLPNPPDEQEGPEQNTEGPDP